ncbi:MAG: ribonuclease III [Gammaproteobacteria bacterium]|nr:ribonuclease III [Gammaproteobacteria bacterium]
MTPIEKLIPEGIMDSPVFEQALIHRSKGKRNNERLEFLGDAVLNLVIADALYHQLPDEKEGILSRLRATLVNKDSLAELGAALDLGSLVKLGPGELKSGGFRRDSILADAMEAIIGAVYELKGYQVARQYILDVYSQKLQQLPDLNDLKDPKSQLQEYLQGRGKELPVYELVEVTGEAHDQYFKVQCLVKDLGLSAPGEGGSRKKAEQEAAARLLEQIK